MPLTASLFQCEDPTKWRKVSDLYWDVVEAMAVKKKRLLELDRWFQEDLPNCICARTEKCLTKGELAKLMEWKLLRGKFRPRLQKMVESNPEDIVERHTKKAFEFLPDVGKAVDELCHLKGVGPATASAILCAGAPDLVAFMADEAVESVPGLTPVQYNLKHYQRFLQELQKKADSLSAGGQDSWTPHRVELCLWAWKVAHTACPKMLETLEDEDERPTKKLKTK
ncbi:uncharacterized protein [Hyperolius riggenbachi]|uniref:uncharacterized protein n=1 Tax=Hyperolius riggenbachi TaxID=752182 RepID=UPI0035A37C98